MEDINTGSNGSNSSNGSSRNTNLKILGIVLIIVGIGLTFYFAFAGFGSDTRDDDLSLGQINDLRSEKPVVLYFWGSGCGSCEEQKPIIHELEDDYQARNVSFYWFDAGNHDDLTNEYNVRGVPTTVVLNQGGVVENFVGLAKYDDIAAAIEDSIESY